MLSYPFLFEVHLSRHAQARLWGIGLFLYAFFCALCIRQLLKRAAAGMALPLGPVLISSEARAQARLRDLDRNLERLPDLQEGYLDAMTMEAVRAHLSVCFLCMKEYNELEQTVRMVENLPFVEPLTSAVLFST